MSAYERNAATETINRLLKPYIKRTENRRVLADGQGIAIGRFCPCRTKTRRKNSTCPISNRNTRRMWFTPSLPTAPNKNANAAAPNCMSPIHRQKIRVHQLVACCWSPSVSTNAATASGQAGGYYDATSPPRNTACKTQTLGVGFGRQLTDTSHRPNRTTCRWTGLYRSWACWCSNIIISQLSDDLRDAVR